ncbi:NTF2 fold immunity protein [Pseudomonas syringae]|uniref:NTF2 fold immunity protein n=1 Tax=Pseudomonas syringae TaxID=317 RepID=UPI0009B45602|nr:NTF2 fold immunity protein [Pseudomonas syringae]QGG78323.1 hypothetical protein N028_24520 [Pseudomonas syringae USA011]
MAQSSTTKSDADLSEAIVERTFRDFSAALCNWELWLYKHKRSMRDLDANTADADERVHAELLAIFSVHVTKKSRNYDRLENLVCSAHPEYEFDNDSVKLEISSKKW